MHVWAYVPGLGLPASLPPGLPPAGMDGFLQFLCFFTDFNVSCSFIMVFFNFLPCFYGVLLGGPLHRKHEGNMRTTTGTLWESRRKTKGTHTKHMITP